MNRNAILGLGLIAAALTAPIMTAPALAQPPGGLRGPPDETLKVMPLRGGAYWVSGGISNTGFVVGDKGVVLIDPQMFVPTARKEIAEIAKVTPKPIDTVILTHSDPDHINGLPAYPHGIAIIAHENTKQDILGVIADPKSNGTPPPPEIRDYVPTRTLRHSEDVTLDGVKMRLIHIGPAHTDGDIVVYLPAQKIVFTGDLVTPNVGPWPALHLNKHGSSLGWIKSMKAILALDADTYVSGHGEMLSKAELGKRLVAAEQRRATIKVMYDQGKTLDEIKAQLHDAPVDAGGGLRFPTFVETTYQELTYE